jgi:hypothetical protein
VITRRWAACVACRRVGWGGVTPVEGSLWAASLAVLALVVGPADRGLFFQPFFFIKQ